MKKTGLMIALFAALAFNAQSQNKALNDYYALKDALVAGNSGEATKRAIVLKTELEKDFPEQNILLTETDKIIKAKNINDQRSHFAPLSAGMYTLAKTVKLSNAPVYYQYCPMKKSYWLSSRSAIENPYYGNSMLTCGKVSDTIQ